MRLHEVVCVCVCLRVCVVTGCSSTITATWTKKDVDQDVLLPNFLAAVLTHGWLRVQNGHTPIAVKGPSRAEMTVCSASRVSTCPELP